MERLVEQAQPKMANWSEIRKLKRRWKENKQKS